MSPINIHQKGELRINKSLPGGSQVKIKGQLVINVFDELLFLPGWL
jgi:hypothetical protein